MLVSDDEKRALLSRVRRAIELKLTDENALEELAAETAPSTELAEERGVFVTLKSHGRLRGCIGYVKPIGPLWNVIPDAAMSAAFRDPRFNPVEEPELDDIEIEISILSPLEPIESTDDIELGRHGIFIDRGWVSGLLMPQVATEHGMDLDTFISHTCLKAQLPTDTWKKGLDGFNRFTAEVFSEEEFPQP